MNDMIIKNTEKQIYFTKKKVYRGPPRTKIWRSNWRFVQLGRIGIFRWNATWYNKQSMRIIYSQYEISQLKELVMWKNQQK